MKAVVLAGVGDVRVEDVPEPRLLEPTDAIVEVRAAAICGADLFPLHGLTPGFENGTVMGHEFAGVVLDKGDAVSGVEVGQRVVNTSMVADGTCPACRAGRVTQCSGRALFGYSGVYPRLDGGQAELVRVPHADRVLAPLPEAVADEAAVFLSDNLPTAYDAVVSRGGVREGDLVCVVGLGAVGLMAVMCAVDAGARVLAVDGVDARRSAAERLGARALSPDDASEAVAAASEGLGADVVVEAAGSPGALDAALRLARGRGTVSVVGAHFEPDFPLDNHLMFERELTLRFSIGDAAGHRDHLLELIAGGRLDPASVVSHRLPLDEAAEAYRLFDGREAVKVVLRPEG
ncbi:MAG TPA: alcohol dehydrogenase catalytic domain-containing protein [Gaiellaceae bacterium]|nr:alcohol dehydrogenase catalytic domain-containing protein [Gaiellaceae bacterium]